jgi:muramoyltetrapeptide carboxypeptidase
MLCPAPLRSNDVVAIVPTARAIQAGELTAAKALAESWGLRVRMGQGVGRKHFQQAGTAAERAADLQKALEDPDVRAIWCARGGYGTVQLLEHLDLDVLKRDPKWVVGFSDVTVLHSALHKIGLCTLHAPMPYLLANKTAESVAHLRAALFGQVLPVRSDQIEGVPDRPGLAHAPVVGGNLSLLYGLRGTPYDLDPAGKILFLEDLDELLYHVDRMVMNLRLGGWFSQLAGLVVGGFTQMRNKDGQEPFGASAEEILQTAVAGTNYPVCFGFPAGHLADNRALVLGKKATLHVSHSGATWSV